MARSLVPVCIHFVWATWDRLPLITDVIEHDLYRYISAVCRDDRFDVLAIGGMPDHVHLLVVLSSTVSMADLMRHVEGGSSRFVSETLMPGQWFEWQGSYVAFSVGVRDKDRVIAYIARQKQHHVHNTLWPIAEQTHDPSAVPAKAATGPKAT